MDTSAFEPWLDTFARSNVEVSAIETVFYVGPVRENRKTCLFVHGINGDYHAFAPLAFELRDVCNIIFVELPGHGASGIPNNYTVELFGIWAQGLEVALRSIGSTVDVVVGHSFGGYIAQETNIAALVLLNPPFAVTALSRNGSRIMRALYPVVGRFYHSYAMMVWRGKWLLYAKTPAAIEIMKWVSKHTKYSREQIAFQAHLGDLAANTSTMDIAKIRTHKVVAVVTGQFDRIVDGACVTKEDLPEASFLSLPTNHVSIFEKPAEVAAFIAEICL